ncbi:MAG: AAA family ATPase [Chloroflexi bacterium]|nr:AAA family ATPase [Chloroflexota bacterium]
MPEETSPFTGSILDDSDPSTAAALLAAARAVAAARSNASSQPGVSDDSDELDKLDDLDEPDDFDDLDDLDDSDHPDGHDGKPSEEKRAADFWAEYHAAMNAPFPNPSAPEVPREFYDSFSNPGAPAGPDSAFGPRLQVHHGPLIYNTALRAQYNYRLNLNTLAVGAAPPEDQPWVVHDLIRSGELSLIVGDSASKKTFLLLHLALHVALGLPWLGRPVQSTPVLYFENDLGHDAVHHRISLLQRGLAVAAVPPLHFASFTRWNFPAQEEADLLAHAALRHNAGLVIFDPLLHLGSPGPENDLHALQQTIAQLRGVALDLGIAIVLVHHLNKRGHYRGVSHLKGLVDTMLLVQSNPHTPILHAETPKTRSAAGQRFAARFHVHPPGSRPDLVQFHLLTDTDPACAASRSAHTVPTQILNHLVLHGPASRRALHAALPHISPNSINSSLTRLMNQKHLLRRDHLYFVS